MTSIRATQIPLIISVLWIVTLTIVGFIWRGIPAHAQDQLGGWSNSTDLIGKLVKNVDGKNVGKIKDLVINWRRDGYIEYAVLSFGGLFGVGDECFAVPWEALKPSDNKEYFVLNVKEEQFKDAARFVVYRFYDRSSAAVLRAERSSSAQSADVMKGGMMSDLNASIAKPFSMQYAMEAEFHR